MNKEDKIKKYKQDNWGRRIQQAIEKEAPRHEEAVRYNNYYRSRFYTASGEANESSNGNKLFSQEPLVSVNEVFPHVNDKCDRLFFKNPECLLTARKNGDNDRYKDLAEMITASLPFIFQKTDIQAAMRECIRDEGRTGAGFLEVGYFHPMRVVNKSELSQDDLAKLYDLNTSNIGNSSLNNLVSQTSGYYDISSLEGMEDKALIPNATYNRKIKPNMPYVLHVKWNKVYDDPEAEDEDGVYWRIKEFQMPIDEIKSNYGLDIAAENTSDNQLGTLYEVHMMYPKKKVFIVGKEGEVATGTVKDYPYNIEFLSIHKFALNKIGNNECFSDIRIFEDQQLEENKLRSRQAKLLDIYKSFFFFDKKVDPNAMMDIRYADDGTGIGIDTQDQKLNEVLYFPPTPPTPRDLMNELDIQIGRDISRMTGRSEMQRGQSSGGSATESSIIRQGELARADSQLYESMKYFERVVEDLIRICLQFWTPEQWAKASGWKEEQIVGLLQYDIENFKSNVDEFDFDFQVNIDSSKPVNKDSIRESLTLAIQALGNPEVATNPVVKSLLPPLLKTYNLKDEEVNKIMEQINQPPTPPPPPPPEPKIKTSISISMPFDKLVPEAQDMVAKMWVADLGTDGQGLPEGSLIQPPGMEGQPPMPPAGMMPPEMGGQGMPPAGMMPPGMGGQGMSPEPGSPFIAGQQASQEFNPNQGVE